VTATKEPEIRESYSPGEQSSLPELLALAASPDEPAALIRALRSSWTSLVATDGASVRALMDGLPAELWDSDPWLVGGYAATWRSVGSTSRSAALPYFEAAFGHVTEATPVPIRVGLELHYAAALRSLGRITEAHAAATRAGDLLAADSSMPLQWRIWFRARVALQVGIALYHLGDYDAAKTDLRTAAGLAASLFVAERVECFASLALLEYTLGEFDTASGYVEQARGAAGDSGLLHSPFGAPALISQLLITVERNLLDEAEELASDVARASARSDWEPLGAYSRAAISIISELYVDGLDLLRQCLQSYRTWRSPGPIVTLSEGLRATILLRLGQTDTAWDILGALSPTQRHANCPARFIAHLRYVTGDASGTLAALRDCTALGDAHSGRTLVDVHLLTAAANYRLGNPALADLSFDQALILAAHNGMRIPFRLVPGDDMRMMLERAAERQQPDAVRALFTDVDVWGSAAPGDSAPQLSDREREIVRALLSGSTVPEMADALFISVNTVKSHLKSVYRKLAVSSRPAAVKRARELGLHL